MFRRPARLTRCVAPGESVAANQEIAQLDDVKLHRDVVRLTGELRVAQSRVESLQARLNEEPDAAAQLEVAQQMVVDVEHQLGQRQKDEKALTLTAPIAGLVMEPPEVPRPSVGRPKIAELVGHAAGSEEQAMLLGTRDARLPGGRPGFAGGRVVHR